MPPVFLDDLVNIIECKEIKGGYYAFNIKEADFAQEQVEARTSALSMGDSFVGRYIENWNVVEIIEDIVTTIKQIIEDIVTTIIRKIEVWPRPVELELCPRPARLWPTRRLVGSEFSDRMEVHEVLSWLTRDQISSIGIYGMGGVGKTTLVTRIHNKLLQKDGLFPRLYWVTVSQDFSIQKLQDDIAKVIGLEFGGAECTWIRAAILSYELSKHGKFVLILDDLWDHFDVVDVGIPIERNGNNKLLIVSKSLKVVRKMNCQRELQVQPLHNDDALELFDEKLGRELTSNEKKIAKSIVRECGGLPRGIVLIAAWMRTVTDIRQLKIMLEQLRDSKYRELDIETKVLSILNFNYTFLKGNSSDCVHNELNNSSLSTVAYPQVQVQNLEVLNLSNTNLEILPVCVVDLHNLRALFLRNCRRLRQVPSLAGLKMLVVLDLSWSKNIEEVPEGLELMSQLKYLNLYHIGLKKFPAEILENLTSIQFLASGAEVDSSFGVEVEDLANLRVCVI